MPIKFNKFEKIHTLLERYSPEETDAQLLEAYGLDASDLELVNTINEGFFDKFKNMLSKALPGGSINKAEKILTNYDNIKKDTLKKIGSLRDTAFKAKVKANANKDDQNVQDVATEANERAKKAIRTLESAEEKQITAIEDQLRNFIKDKPDRVKTYVNLRVAGIQQKLAELEMKDAQEYASEDELKKLEKIVKERGRLVQQYDSKLKKLVGAKKEDKKVDTKEEDKKIDDAKEKVEAASKPANAKEETEADRVKSKVDSMIKAEEEK